MEVNVKKYGSEVLLIMKIVVVFLAVLLVCAALDLNFDDGDDTAELEDLSDCEYKVGAVFLHF